ncbi:hypothetical protein QFC22_006699 [Naganishia vaughanmartiniae]|uniref:Uncharacterized protein n=1 Tax=Naganishia vaughanmartiniae TaxID=1424756 RepID=A0ACC2WGZ2_9TREE|nr:hypothetical protein QFC22_006699 [Naganishia vaughanmartiniae]
MPFAEPSATSTAVSSSSSSIHDDQQVNNEKSARGFKGDPQNEKQSSRVLQEPGSIPTADAGYHHLGAVWEGLTVIGTAQGTRTVESTERSLLQMWNLPSFIMTLFNIKIGKSSPIISDFYGVVPAGQTLLVLGRPGAGCSTLLRAITNETSPFVRVDGELAYGNISSKEAGKRYRGEIVFNSEEDIHLPTLNVSQTLSVSHRLKRPAALAQNMNAKEYAQDQIDRVLNMFGMNHTRTTKVGNDFVRGVSGGERKRVSLSEIFSTNAAFVCWDNCIRGLDSAVALHFLRCLKEISRSTGMVNVASIYQASNDVYGTCFDKVCVIFQGRMVYFGAAEDAVEYFYEQGWERKARQTIPDYLTACTSITERRMRSDRESSTIPQSPEEMATYFKASPQFASLQREIAEYKQIHAQEDHSDQFRQAVEQSKRKATGRSNAYKVPFYYQVWVLSRRQLDLVLSTPIDFVIRLASNILQATIVGSIFYKPAADAAGSYAVAGGLFFTVLYFCVFSLSEIPPTVYGRALLIKHRKLGFYDPAAKIVAEMAIDAVVYAVQTLVFASIFYFLLGLNANARYFFTFYFIIYSTYMNLAVMYRFIAAWCPNLSIAIRFGGLALGVVLAGGGFMVPPPNQRKSFNWSKWLGRISPVAYAFEALLSNEFRVRTLSCATTELVPNGPGYTDLAYQGCTIPGSSPGSDSVSGSTYVSTDPGLEGSTIMVRDTGCASTKSFKLGAKKDLHGSIVTEDGDASATTGGSIKGSTFTFKDVCYTVQADGKPKKLLDNVTGIVEPGRLTALMGASGGGVIEDDRASNKRLTLATTGIVEGDMRLNGRPLESTFSRCTGFGQQGDVHEPYATVRESLQFSALLRQPKHVPRADKLQFAEDIIHLLELEPIADALIGDADMGGLGVEERKRVTIGVELAAKPDTLLFLDEPTSGLDSQAAYEICRLLRKIAATSGLAICCVIHQPSGDLFEMFDAVILLAPGGKTCYAGPTGPDACVVSSYFAKYGAGFPPEANPAEFLIATIAPVGGGSTDWPARWNHSAECAALKARVDDAHAHSVSENETASAAQTGTFANTYLVQTKELLKRNFIAQWRNGSYWTTKLVLCGFFGVS